MTEQELMESLQFVLRTIPDDDRADRVAAILDVIESSDAAAEFEATDRTVVGSSAAYAFQWEDVLNLGDIWDILKGTSAGLSPSELAKILVALVKGWAKLRSVRISLNERQFKVLRAVKQGNNTAEAIAAYTGLAVEDVTSVGAELEKLRYKQDIPILKVSGNSYSTDF